MAGGGVKGGFQYGRTDDHGYEAIENKMHIHDWHATILNLLGLDQEKLTYRYAGREMRLPMLLDQWRLPSFLKSLPDCISVWAGLSSSWPIVLGIFDFSGTACRALSVRTASGPDFKLLDRRVNSGKRWGADGQRPGGESLVRLSSNHFARIGTLRLFISLE